VDLKHENKKIFWLLIKTVKPIVRQRMRGRRIISYYLKYLALLLVSLPLMNSPVRAEMSCESILASGSIKEMRPCAELKYQAAEKTLKKTLERVNKDLDDKSRKSLNKAQIAWNRYRLLDCYSYSLQVVGQLRPIFNNICRSKLTKQRNAVLKEQYEEN
jgi:uncharacterized protein YecT (DUF1311 family)